MMKTITMSVILGCVVLLSACAKNLTGPDEVIPAGAFRYMAYDQAGTKIVEGWLTLVFQNATTVSGQWKFKQIGNPQNIGPQVGEGNLEGDVQNGNQLIINLNPAMADNNVFLAGTYTPNEILGVWNWYTLAGTANQGTFKAFK